MAVRVVLAEVEVSLALVAARGEGAVLRHTLPSRSRLTHPVGGCTDALRRRLTELDLPEGGELTAL